MNLNVQVFGSLAVDDTTNAYVIFSAKVVVVFVLLRLCTLAASKSCPSFLLDIFSWREKIFSQEEVTFCWRLSNGRSYIFSAPSLRQQGSPETIDVTVCLWDKSTEYLLSPSYTALDLSLKLAATWESITFLFCIITYDHWLIRREKVTRSTLKRHCESTSVTSLNWSFPLSYYFYCHYHFSILQRPELLKETAACRLQKMYVISSSSVYATTA